MSLDPNMCRIEFIIASILLPKIFASPITMCDEFASFSCDIDSLAEGHAHPLQWTRCIPREKRCDGFKDCFSGIDELDCSTSCLSTETQCRNGACISKDYICDGDKDCPDGEDELNCSTEPPKEIDTAPSTNSTISLNTRTVNVAIFWVVIVFLSSAFVLYIWRRNNRRVEEEVRVVQTIEPYPPPPSYRDSLTIVDFFPSGNIYPSMERLKAAARLRHDQSVGLVARVSKQNKLREGTCSQCGQSIETTKKKNYNGFYLGIIIGHSINLQMSSSERYEFKKDYEKFKLRVTLINLVLLLAAFFFPSRPIDAVCHFLMVWYYCTLTIRECILLVNGSKMHWWWVFHHYMACVIGGTALTWPDDSAYQAFRPQFILFTGYICLIQQLQYQYQSGCLRRLHALGVGDTMDVTLEGFASWMFHGLTFLLPFLTIAYLIELYNSYTLFYIWKETTDVVWQVLALSVLFFVVGTGNIFFVALIVAERMKQSAQARIHELFEKYSFLDPKKKE